MSNSANDAYAIKSMVGFGQANVAHQYSGALCASIGSLAAAKRSCAVGIALTDVNKNIDGSVSQRGAAVLAAQNNTASFRTPFGQADGHGLYGDLPEEVQAYANRALLKHSSLTVPTSAGSATVVRNTARPFRIGSGVTEGNGQFYFRAPSMTLPCTHERCRPTRFPITTRSAHPSNCNSLAD